jgi:hypothetical protein
VPCLLIRLVEECGPALDGAGHHAQVDQVEGCHVVPVQLEVVNEELDVDGDTGYVSDMLHGKENGDVGARTYKVGWMGLTSTPTI